jgi:hypothetical protein
MHLLTSSSSLLFWLVVHLRHGMFGALADMTGSSLISHIYEYDLTTPQSILSESASTLVSHTLFLCLPQAT